MKFSVPIKFGARVIQIEDEAEDLREMFRKMDMYDALPAEGPSGEEDLQFCHRVVKNGKGQPCTYYSVICPSAGQEFKFGILADGSGIFPKGWEPLQRGAHRDQHEEEEQEPQPRGASAPQSRAVDVPDELDQIAEKLVATVRKESNGYTVLSNPVGSARYTVIKVQNKLVCACKRFEAMRKVNPEVACEHIRALRLSVRSNQAA